MKKAAFVFVAIASVLLLTLAFLSQVVAPRKIKAEAKKRIEAACPSCEVEIGSVGVSLFFERIYLYDVTFNQGDAFYSRVEAKVKEVRANLAIRQLFSRRIRFDHVTILEPTVEVIEGDGISPLSPDTPTHIPEHWTYEVAHTELEGGTFAYRRIYGKREAVIRVSEIDATITPWGNAITREATRAEASGRLEQTGKFRLTITAPLYAGVTEVDVTLKIDRQNLADLNPFFRPSEGIELSGALYAARTEVSIRDQKLDAWVQAKYAGLDIDFEKNRDRSGLTAFFSNLVESVKVRGSVLRRGAPEQTRGVSLERRQRESLVSFVFRGMKEAALRVATDD